MNQNLQDGIKRLKKRQKELAEFLRLRNINTANSSSLTPNKKIADLTRRLKNSGVRAVSPWTKYLKSDTIILSNIYPSYEDLYRNMFVHARVKAYQSKGFYYNVLCINPQAADRYREYDGVNVIEGRSPVLVDVMHSGKIKKVCVHFLNEMMYEALKEHLPDIKLMVWVHGIEIQPWWRRDFNNANETERDRAKKGSEKRMDFWRKVFTDSESNNIHFVFVSQYFADEIMEDYKISLPKEKYTIIHNAIDTENFNYVKKDPEQRKKIFVCCPWVTNKYANDLSIRAIKELAKERFFKDLEFHISGKGPLFKELTSALRKYKNITLEETYYSHQEISDLHKKFGVCLIPTRWDSQGVSRDEAMSSGLVPITSNVAAIPEFVDSTCGILAPYDDYHGLAEGIRTLYHNPDLFTKLSENAAKRVRKQSAADIVIGQELELIESKTEGAKIKILLYADVDLNIIDGSSIWLVSLSDVLSQNPNCEVHVMLKRSLENTTLLDGMQNKDGVKWVDPFSLYKGNKALGVRLSQSVALELLQDYGRGFDIIILRQIGIEYLSALHDRFLSRCFLYTIVRDNYYDAAVKEMLKSLLQRSAGFFTQTNIMRIELANILDCEPSTLHLMPPMIPDTNLDASAFKNKSSRLVYSGKFAAVWYAHEIVDAVKKLYDEGVDVRFDVAGDKFHPDVNKDVLIKQYRQMPNVNWHGRLTRKESMDLIAGSDIGISWRDPAANNSCEALDISTKVLEYAMNGKPVLLNPTPVHKELLGDDYPLFVDTQESFYEKVRLVTSDESVYLDAARRCYEAAKYYSYKEAVNRLSEVLDL